VSRPRVGMVAIGASWGGLEAIGRLLAALPSTFRAPIAVVQHRGSSTPAGVMQRYLGVRSALPVVEVQDKEPVEPGHIYLGPPDYHLLVAEQHMELSLEAPVAFSRPSVDVLFETAADSYGAALTAVVLTGANADGSRGVVAVRAAGGMVLAQDPAEAERSEMPEAAIATGAVHEVHPIDRLAARLTELDNGE
jgi:two-component system chemotaxis response regulator CheB